MRHAHAKQSQVPAETQRAARQSSAPAAFADPTPRRAPAPGPAPATRPGKSPCACGGGCPRCGGSADLGATASLPVPGAIRSRAEATLGVGLGDVRIAERGPLAHHVARRGADAGTRDNVIAFPRGLPDLSRPAGQFALGHELAHVAQQRRAPDAAVRSHSAVFETGADMAARSIAGGQFHGARIAERPAETQGGQPVQFGIFEDIGAVARTVNDFVAPVVDPIAQMAHSSIAELMISRLDIPALAMTFVTELPWRILRIFADVVQGAVGAGRWLRGLVGLFVNWQGWSAVWNHLYQGLIDGAAWAGELFIHALEVVGVGEALQFLWSRFNLMAPLNSAQIGAAQEVHPPGLIPYSRVRVDYNSLVARLAELFSPGFSGSVADQLFGTAGADHRAVTTMHVIHTGHTMDEQLAVHELTHVAQYELIGAMYMPEAVYAQQWGQGYDYKLLHGSLSASITADATYADFNREQQAMICEDYYLARHGQPTERGGSAPDLEYFVNDYWGRAGIPLLRMFLDQ